MTAMSFPVVGLALWFDAAYAPPWWVHLVTTMPLLIVLCALPLRPLKGWLVCSQYFYKAEEGRLAVTNTSSDVDTGRPQARDPGHQERLSPSKLEGDGALNHGESGVCNYSAPRLQHAVQAGFGSDIPARVRRIATIARMARRRAVSITERISA